MPTEADQREQTAPATRWQLPLALLAAVVTGACLVLQSRMNGALSGHTGPWVPTWVSFASGWVLLTACWAVPAYRRRVRRVWTALREGRLAWWQVLGGANGGMFVLAQAWAVPAVGVATFLLVAVAGQTASALLVDRIGIGSAPRMAVTPSRVAAALVAVAGVGLMVWPGADADLAAAATLLLPAVAALAVGMGLAFQQALNGRVTTITRDGFATAWVNFSVGLAAVLVVGTPALLASGVPAAGVVAEVPPWAWWGGACGVVIIAMSAWAVQHSGVLAFGLVSITSQLGGGLLLDLLTPTADRPITATVLVGAAVTVVAACWAGVAAQRSRRRRTRALPGPGRLDGALVD